MVWAQSTPALAAPPTFVNVCTGLGVNLPVVGQVSTVASGVLGGVLDGVLNPVIGDVNTTIGGALSGKPISVGVLDPATGSFVSVPAAACNVSGNSFQVNNNLGLSLGGGVVTGLGGTGNVAASAGSPTAIALGNGSVTATGATNAMALGTGAATGLGGINAIALGAGATTGAGAVGAMALGTGATVSAANSVALGTNALAARGALTNYTAPGLTALQNSVGEVSVGAIGAERQITHLAAGSQITDAVNVGQLRGAIDPLTASSKLAVTYLADGVGNATPVVNLAGNGTLPIGTSQVTLTGLAPGALTAVSKDAVNGAQLFAAGSTTAAALGVAFDPATGQLATPHFTVQGGNYTNVGSAFSAVDTALNTLSGATSPFVSNNVAGLPTSIATAANASAGGFGASATGAASTVIGNAGSDHGVANSTVLGSGAGIAAGLTGSNVALGQGSLASQGARLAYTAPGLATLQNSIGEVSVGTALAQRQLTNVAAGSAASDAATVGQLLGAINPINAVSKLSVAYVPDGLGNPTAAVNLAGNVNLPVGTAQVALRGVAAGGLNAASRDAVNGSQLFAAGSTTAAALGVAFDPTTGQVVTPHFTVQGANYNNVASALGAIDAALTINIGGGGGGGTGAFASNNAAIALAPVASGANSAAGGFGASATGSASTVVGNGAADNAVANSTVIGNGATVTAGLTGSNVALGQGSVAATGALTGYTAPGLTGTQSSAGEVSVGTAAGPRQITNVAAGLSASDALNVGQLQGATASLGASIGASLGGGVTYNTATGTINNPTYTIQGSSYNSVDGALTALSGAVTAGQKYVQIRSTLGNAAATGMDSVAIGPVAVAGGASSVALGNNAAAGGTSSTALGSGSAAGGDLSTAIGNVASASGLSAVALGNSASAKGTSATALGTGASAARDFSTAIGNVATAGGLSSVALGNSASAAGNASTALGTASSAAGDLSAAIGNLAKAGGVSSVALGNGASAGGKSSTALGSGAAAVGDMSASLGTLATASGVSSLALGNGALSQGTNSVALGAGSSDGGLANVVSVGAAGAERRITNVGAGTLSAASTDAVNGSQLYQTNVQVASLGHSSIQYDSDPTGHTLSSVTLSSDQGGPVVIHNLAPGVATSDAATVGQVQTVSRNSVQYTIQNGVKSNLIALSGGSPGAVTIRNVANGVNASDAVNVAQVQSYGDGLMSQASAYTDQQVSNLAAYTQKQISQARSDAAGGTALALAASGLRYVDSPGKYSVAGATSYYHDQMGIAFGVGHTSEDGRWRLNASITAAPTMTNPDIGVVAGASLAIN